MGIRMGIIGAGVIGKLHTQVAKRHGVEVIAVADVNEQAAKVLAEAEDIPNVETDPQKVFDRDEIDAVAVCVPNKFHKDLAVAAMQAGKDVLLEKPMAMNAAECAEINEVASKAGRILQMGFVYRYGPASQTARAFIDAGRVGEAYHAKATLYRRRGIPGLGGWFTTKAISGGGPLIDIGVHAIDQVLYLTDFPKPRRVSGKVYCNFGKRMGDYVYEGMWAGPPKLDGVCDVEDAAHALVRFDGGLTLDINVTWAGNFPQQRMPNLIAVMGDRGGITFSLGGSDVVLSTEMDGRNVDIEPKIKNTDRWDGQYEAFIHSVTTREQPPATGEHGRIVQAIIDAIYRSSEEDREIEVEL